MILCCLAFVLLLPLSRSYELFYEVPDRNISHCSRKLNVSSEIGCSSKYPYSSGKILVADNASFLLDSLRNHPYVHIVVIPLKLFVNQSITKFLRESQNVAGMLVFSPNFPSSGKFDRPKFSENSLCPNGNLNFYNDTARQCNVNPKWNPPASNYAMISWPFPVVFATSSEVDIWDEIWKCYTTFNVNLVDDTHCFMEIRNYMSGVQSSQTCYNRELLLRYRLEQNSNFCSQIGGVNLMLRSRNVTSTSEPKKPNPTVLVLTRIDSLSMFDRRATSGFSVLPAVSVLASTAAHVMQQPAFKEGRFRKNVLFAFLDNEALSFMGSQRFGFDLFNGHIGKMSGTPFTPESIESVIELSGIGLANVDAATHKSTYYLLSDPEIAHKTSAVTQGVWKSLNDSAKDIIQLLNGSSSGTEPMLLPPSASTQQLLLYFSKLDIPLSHTIISDRPGKPPFADDWMDSFLDDKWPPEPTADQRLLQLANVLADAVYREASGMSEPIPELIKGVTPGELMNCFLKDPGCDLLRMHLEPEIIDLLVSLGGPIPMQTYEPVDGHGWRVSHVVARLLMGLTGERLAQCPVPGSSSDHDAFTYMYGYYNGSTWCYRSLIETSTSFFFLENDEVASPGWVRSVTFENKRYVRLFRSSSPSNDILCLVLGILLTTSVGVLAFVLQWFSAQLFTQPYDNPSAVPLTTNPL